MVENNNYLESRFTPVCVPFSPTFGAKRDVCTTSYFYFSFIVHFMYVCMQYVLFHVYQGGSFLNFIFYSFLSPENNVRNGEKKSSQDLLDVKKYLGVAAGHYEDFTSTFISFTFHSTLQFPKFQSVHTFHISPQFPCRPSTLPSLSRGHFLLLTFPNPTFPRLIHTPPSWSPIWVVTKQKQRLTGFKKILTFKNFTTDGEYFRIKNNLSRIAPVFPSTACGQLKPKDSRIAYRIPAPKSRL